MLFSHASRVAGLSLALLAACRGPEPEAEPGLELNVTAEASEGLADLTVAIAWAPDDGPSASHLSLQGASGTVLGSSPSPWTFEGRPRAYPSTNVLWGVDDYHELHVGYLVLVPRDHGQQLPRYSEFPGVSTEFATDSSHFGTDYWCSPDADCSIFEEDCASACYREHFECTGPFESDCVVTSREGDLRLTHPWGAARAVATDWLVLYAERDIPQEALDQVGLHFPLTAGYHLLHVTELKGPAQDASRACWKRAAMGAADNSLEAERRAFDELGCSVPHLGFELADTADLHFVAAASAQSPLFDLRQFPRELGNLWGIDVGLATAD
jgi:hypothetical protein